MRLLSQIAIRLLFSKFICKISYLTKIPEGHWTALQRSINGSEGINLNLRYSSRLQFLCCSCIIPFFFEILVWGERERPNKNERRANKQKVIGYFHHPQLQRKVSWWKLFPYISVTLAVVQTVLTMFIVKHQQKNSNIWLSVNNILIWNQPWLPNHCL